MALQIKKISLSKTIYTKQLQNILNNNFKYKIYDGDIN